MNDAVEIEPTPAARHAGRFDASAEEPRVAAWVALPIGIAAATIGLAPWWISGARLPLQYLWESSALPEAMPIALLPFSQYTVIQIFSLLVVGAAVAGITGRALRLRGWGILLVVVGVLVVQAGATVQTARVVREGLQDRLESDVYVIGLVAGTTLSILVGITVTVLIARAPRAGALLGLTIGAIGMASWTSALLDPTRIGDGPFATMLVIVPWIAPVLTGIAIAWTGVDTVARVIAGLLAIALIWISPAVMTALANALGNQVLIHSSADVIDYGVAMFQMALLTPELALRPIITTVVVAFIGLAVRAAIARRRRVG